MAKANVLRLRAVGKNESKKRIHSHRPENGIRQSACAPHGIRTPGLPVRIRDEIPEPELYALLFLPGRLSPDRRDFRAVAAHDRRRQAGRPVSERSRNQPHFVSLSAMRQETKKIAVATEAPSGNLAAILTSAPWYYAGIQYGDHLMGLLVQTGDEQEARREAKKVCSQLGDQARLLEVQKVVVQ